MSKAKTAAIPKSILKTSKVLQIVSPYLATRFGIKLFSTPVKFKTPKRERSFLKKSEVLKHGVFSLVHKKPAKILLAQKLKVFLTPCFGNSRFLNTQGLKKPRVSRFSKQE